MSHFNQSDLLTKFVEVHGNFYDYTQVKYFRGSGRYVSILCPNHGTFIQRANDHVRGHGCKKCGSIDAGHTKRKNVIKNHSNQNTKQDHIFYKVKFTHKMYHISFLKVGITSQTIQERLKGATRDYNYEIIECTKCSYLESLKLEEDYMHKNKDNRFLFPENMKKFFGYTECFNI